MEIYSVDLHIQSKYGKIRTTKDYVFGRQSECGKMRTRITPNMDTFYTVTTADMYLELSQTYMIELFSKNS